MGNPFDDPALVGGYEAWYAGRGRRADREEKCLLAAMLRTIPLPASVLEVGCGTGHFTRWLRAGGFRAVGVDLSSRMLAEAGKHGGSCYVHADGLDLPFDDESFDVVTLITTLEFVADPRGALSEGVRVARKGLLLGVLNRCSLLARRRTASATPPWNIARFFSVGELTRLVRDCAGERLAQIRWRTTLWPAPAFGSLRLPWGGFIGMLAQLRPAPGELGSEPPAGIGVGESPPAVSGPPAPL